MRAALFEKAGEPLRQVDLPISTPGQNQVLIRVGACAVCRTDLHIIDGELTQPKLPLIPGHEIVGTVVAVGKGASRFTLATGSVCRGWVDLRRMFLLRR